MSDGAYILLWFYGLLFVVIFSSSANIKDITKKSDSLGFLVIILVILYITYRPISFSFGDTVSYARNYQRAGYWGETINHPDLGFTYLTNILIPFKNVKFYFFVIACLYVIPVAIAFKRVFNNYWYFAFLIFIGSFSFWGYGINGLRNGLATSLILSALLLKNKWIKYILFGIGISMHKSGLLPVAFYFITQHYKNPKKYIYIWLLSIPLTVFTHSFFEGLMTVFNLGEDDDRLSGYAHSIDGDGGLFSRTGFRWDFILYSSIPIIMGYYYIFKYKFFDKLYLTLFNIYIGCNTGWLYCMYVPYNNRFAYLSWFLYPVIISYPILRSKMVVPLQNNWIRYTVFINYAFTFMMTVI